MGRMTGGREGEKDSDEREKKNNPKISHDARPSLFTAPVGGGH